MCLLFGSRHLKDVNALHYQIYQQKYECNNKIIDLSLLPPCRESLKLHILQLCYVAKIWRSSVVARIEIPDPKDHGWTANEEIRWISNAFPNEIEMVLLDDEENSGESNVEE